MMEMNDVTILVNYQDSQIFLLNDNLNLQEEYFLTKIPEESSMIIQQDKKQIYQVYK